MMHDAEVVPGADPNALETDLWMVRYDGEQYWVRGPENDYMDSCDRKIKVLNAVAQHLDADPNHVNLNARATAPVEV